MPKAAKSYSRKGTNSGRSNSSVVGPANSITSNTSVAAVSVNRFGQATFTSFRRQNDCENGNGNYVPLKKSVADNDNILVNKNSDQQITNAVPKPKVYKFFKSRTAPSVDSNSNQNNKNTSNNQPTTPKPLMLNSFSKSDGVKRLTTTIDKSYTKIKNEKTSKSHQSCSNKSSSLSENKSSEINVCEKTIKKLVSPAKTEFVDRKNNVRNATIQPLSTQVQIMPANKNVRSSRRLQGIHPEASQSLRKNQARYVYDKDSASNKFADVVRHDQEEKDNSDNKLNQDASSIFKSDHESKIISEIISENGSEKMQTDSDDTDLMQSIFTESGPKSSHEDQMSSVKIDCETTTTIEKVDDKIYFETTNEQTNDIEESLKIIDDFDDKTKIGTVDEADNYKETTKDENLLLNLESNEEKINVQSNEVKEEHEIKSIPIKPKKKIFFNRDRSKVEFNTKSFFASGVKDEFEIDAEDKVNSQSNNSEKKSTQDNDDDDMYLKIKRVKKAHQCHDLGETEQFDEDIKYYLSGIVSSNSKSMRCLSILGLSQQTMRPEFRMHLRAHDDMPRIIKALMDAPNDPYLALCTATLMFVYNQDRLTMDIDPNALSLILELLETRSDECSQVEEKHRTKVMSLVEEMKNKGYAKYLKLNEITAGKLAMETLLGLTSKRAGDWFKVELRRMKGIDFIVNTVLRCSENYLEEGQMVKIDRCMHVLENVTFGNIENQLYITDYNDSKFISNCITLLQNCKSQIIISNDSKVFLSAFFSILRVLTNLTSESVDGCKVVGSFEGIVELLLDSLFELPSFIMPDQRFDLMVIILCLCINLVEFCEDIRDIVINTEKYMTKLCDLLFKKIEEAAQVEQQTDHLLESHETVQMTEAMQDNLLMQMISKSGTHMEHSLLSACVCLLFGCCIQDNDGYRQILKDILPDNKFAPLIEMLEKLRDFAHLADIMTQKGKDRVTKILKLFKLYK